MTRAEIIYNIRNLLEGGRTSDDALPSYRQIGFIVDYYRAALLRRDVEKNSFISPDYEQDLGCIEFEKVDKADCCSIEVDCDIYKSVKEIPTPVRLYDKPAITFFGAVDKQTSFDLILSIRAPYINYSKWTSKRPRGYYMNKHLWIPEKYGVTKANARIITEQPALVSQFIDCDNEACYTDDSPYPMPADMIETLVKMVMSTEGQIMLKTVSDRINNAQDDTQPTG